MNSEKIKMLELVSDENGVIAALAIDQRNAMRTMINTLDGEERDKAIVKFKAAVSKELTKFSSSILLDPIYGLEAIKTKANDAGLLMAYEVTGFKDDNRRPELLENWSVKRLKEIGANAVKILLYYDVDDEKYNNTIKQAFVERIGSECDSENLPFFLEIITYDNNIKDSKSIEFAKVKPHKVNEAVKEFVKPRYKVDVLKLEVPVNMKYVEGYGEEFVYTREEALKFFKEQSDLSPLPFIFLSAGVSAELFQETLKFARQSGSKFNGVLCGRATWAGGVEKFIEDEKKGLEWLKTEGKKNIESLNTVLKETATSWKEKFEK
ncbi:MAG: tagatose 1,6-diphosphate aldolase [Tissierellia bacterium]|nr:tagatose 1,6-diphosphate aldolase [Tissierellia bacterium]